MVPVVALMVVAAMLPVVAVVAVVVVAVAMVAVAVRLVARRRLGRRRERHRPGEGQHREQRSHVLSQTSSSAITCCTALISARCVKACGKLPR